MPDQVSINWPMLSRHAEPPERAICVNVASREALLKDLEARLADGTGFSVATLNLDHVVKLRRLPGFATAYAAHSHVTADGNPIVWLLRLAGQRASLVPGCEIVVPMAALAARRHASVGFFGSDEATLKAAGEVLRAKVPDLEIAATLAPPMGFDPDSPEADALIAKLKAAGPRVVFVALGAPKQEIFAARLQHACPDIGVLSIGAGLDFLAGSQVRAPAAMRVLALEWAWRWAQNPSRLGRRYVACLAVLPGLAAAALRLRSR